MAKKIILIGGGGHCRSVIDVIESTNKYEIIGIIDNDLTIKDVLGYRVIGSDNDISELSKLTDEFFITIGKIGENKRRVEICNELKSNNLSIATIISPYAYVSKHSKIGAGSIIMHKAIVNVNASIGENCILNSQSLVEHDAVIGSHSHISTASVINGGVKIGNNVFVGSHSTINLNVQICNDAIIASNSLVTKNITVQGTYKGVPVNG